MQREFESSFKPYPATSLLHATHFYFLAIFSQLFENSACHLPLVLAHVTRSESKETTTVLIKQLHLHAMSLCAFTVLNFGLCFVVVVVAVVVVVVVVVAVVVVVVVLLLFLLLFAVLACIHYRGNVSLRPPLHASTFYSRTVVSMFGRRCHLLVHALSSLQVANAKCMTLRSLALVSAQRAKNTGSQQAAGKKHRNGKKHVCSRKNAGGSGKKPPEAGKNASEARKKPAGRKKTRSIQVANAKCMTLRSLALVSAQRAKKQPSQQEKSCFRSGKKHVSRKKIPLRKKSRFAAGKIQSSKKKHLAAAKKHLCSRKNAFWRQREKTARGGKKRVRGKKKTGRGRKKNRSRESPALQPKKSPQRKKYISATGKSSSPTCPGSVGHCAVLFLFLFYSVVQHA